MGRTYAEGLVKHNTRAKLVAINGGKRAPWLASDYHVEYEPIYESVLARSDIDAVILATPHTEHLPETVQAAEHWKHVLVEKPMAIDRHECDQMISACKKANVYLKVIKTLRFRGTPSRAKKLIEEKPSGMLG